MCGIAAILKTNPHESEPLIIQMLNKIEHRGNFNYEYKLLNKAVLGANRLAIVDRNNEIQPLSSPDGRYHIVFNGEIYNYQEIQKELKKLGYIFKTNSDTEVLLAGWIKWPILKFLKKINGMFAFLIYDNKNKSFFAARDHIGIKPLYYAQDSSKKNYFASEIKEISQFNHIPEIKELPPGHYLFNSLIPKQYFTLNSVPKLNDEYVIVSRLRKLFDEAVKIRVQSDLPIGVQFSGGLDSGALLVTARKFHKQVTAIVVGSKESENVKYAVKFCKENNIPMISEILPHRDWVKRWNKLIELAIYSGETIEPNSLLNMPMNMIASQLAKKYGLKIILLSEGADELFCDYPEFKEVETSTDLLQLRHNFLTSLHRTQLQRVDRASMLYTIENRVPYLDKKIIEFALKIDPQLLVKKTINNKKIEKCILRKAFSDRLPKYIWQRPRCPFNEGTGMEPNGPDHKTQQYIETKYKNNEYKQDKGKFQIYINKFNIQNKTETYFLKRIITYNYHQLLSLTERVAINTKDNPDLTTEEMTKKIWQILVNTRYTYSRSKQLKSQINYAIINNQPITIVSFWGIGNKTKPTQVEYNVIKILNEINQEIKKVYPPGLKFIFIISDKHAYLNQFPQENINSYIEKIQKLLHQYHFQTILLSDLYQKYNINSKQIEKQALSQKEWWEHFPLKKQLIKQAQKISFHPEKEKAALIYAFTRIKEAQIISQEFPKAIFLTYNSPLFHPISPNLPTIHFRPDSPNKITTPPWFNYND